MLYSPNASASTYPHLLRPRPRNIQALQTFHRVLRPGTSTHSGLLGGISVFLVYSVLYEVPFLQDVVSRESRHLAFWVFERTCSQIAVLLPRPVALSPFFS